MLSLGTGLGIAFTAGLIGGFFTKSTATGCASLIIVPIGFYLYVDVWQNQHPEAIRSTSALDFVFVPLWTSMAALFGFATGKFIRETLDDRKRK